MNAYQLKQKVNLWVDRSFNYVDLQNVEKVLDNTLFEHIECNRTERKAHEFLDDYQLQQEFIESDYKSDEIMEFIEDNYESDFEDYAARDNYPMWGTLFEFRSEPTEDVLEAAQNAGFGIVSKTEHYNTMLFVRGAGYSFYAEHWIPLYLGLPWIDRTEFEGIDYSMV